MNKSRMVVTLVLFVAGLLIGIVAHVAIAKDAVASALPGSEAASSAQPSKQYPSLSPAEEPPVAAKVADALRQDDAVALALLIQTQDSLKRLRSAILPIVDVSDIRFSAATQSVNGEIVTAYVVRGRDRNGLKWVRGFVINVRHDEVLGVNY